MGQRQPGRCPFATAKGLPRPDTPAPRHPTTGETRTGTGSTLAAVVLVSIAVSIKAVINLHRWLAATRAISDDAARPLLLPLLLGSPSLGRLFRRLILGIGWRHTRRRQKLLRVCAFAVGFMTTTPVIVPNGACCTTRPTRTTPAHTNTQTHTHTHTQTHKHTNTQTHKNATHKKREREREKHTV